MHAKWTHITKGKLDNRLMTTLKLSLSLELCSNRGLDSMWINSIKRFMKNMRSLVKFRMKWIILSLFNKNHKRKGRNQDLKNCLRLIHSLQSLDKLLLIRKSNVKQTFIN